MSSPEEQVRSAIGAKAAEWFVAHRAGGLSESEREAFIDWMRASPAHVREYLALSGLAEELGPAAQRFETPVDALLAQATETAGVVAFVGSRERPRPAQGVKRSSRSSKRGLWLAASILVAAVILTSSWWTGTHPAYSTVHAEQRSWRLDDGSTIHLNSASEIKVRFDAHRRQVDLIRGQAVFQVARDSSRPFVVSAGDVSIEALGTEFDVYRKPQGAVVSVMEGRVAVWSAKSQSGPPAAQLDAGQQVHMTRAAAVVSKKPDDVRKTVAWLQRQIMFDHDPLATAVDEFNRYNDVRIQLEGDQLGALQVSGIFSAYDSESFIRFLERQPGMRIVREANAVRVQAAP